MKIEAARIEIMDFHGRLTAYIVDLGNYAGHQIWDLPRISAGKPVIIWATMTNPEKSYRIGVLCTNFSPVGGAERQAARLIEQEISAGRRPIAIALIPPSESEPEPAFPDIRRLSNSKSRLAQIESWRMLRKICRDENLDALITFTIPANFMGRLIYGWGLRTRIITSFRTSKVPKARQIFLRLTRSREHVANFNSEESRATFAKNGLIEERKSGVIANALPPVLPDRIPFVNKDLDHGRTWLFAGRLITAKGLEPLLDAWATYVKSRPEDKLLIAGEGPLLADLQSQVASLEIGNSVQFLGFIKNFSDLWPRVHFAILSSRWEGSPNFLLEAAVIGAPFVSTRVPGVRGLLPTNVNPDDFTVPIEDAPALAQAMLQLANQSPEALEILSQGLRERVESTNSHAAVMAAWANLITGVR
jgi:glycosyltransferase involved in cell wall biosynthesis